MIGQRPDALAAARMAVHDLGGAVLGHWNQSRFSTS